MDDCPSDRNPPTPYEIIDTPWPRDKALLKSEDGEGGTKELLAIDRYEAIEFRDDTGGVFHRYDLGIGARNLAHYFRYWGTRYLDFSHTQIKFRFLFALLCVLRKLEKHRSTVSILEIGGTIGENFLMLKDALAFEGLGITVEYTVLDIDENLVALGRELHVQNPNFQIVIGEGSDLSRFPDATFDLVISNSVPNHLTDAASGYREACRVARVGVLFHTMVPAEGARRTLTLGGADLRYALLPMSEIKSILYHTNTLYIYDMSKFWTHSLNLKKDENSDGFFIEDIEAGQLQWKLLIFSKYRLFPEHSAFEA